MYIFAEAFVRTNKSGKLRVRLKIVWLNSTNLLHILAKQGKKNWSLFVFCRWCTICKLFCNTWWQRMQIINWCKIKYLNVIFNDIFKTFLKSSDLNWYSFANTQIKVYVCFYFADTENPWDCTRENRRNWKSMRWDEKRIEESENHMIAQKGRDKIEWILCVHNYQ